MFIGHLAAHCSLIFKPYLHRAHPLLHVSRLYRSDNLRCGACDFAMDQLAQMNSQIVLGRVKASERR